MTQQQIIVFCGADKTGKTEISQELSHKLKIPYFKVSREKLKFRNGDHFVNEMKYADPRLIDVLSQTGYSLIMDRGWPCEWVYSRFLNRQTDDGALRYSDNGFSQLGAKIIICYRNDYSGLIDEDRPDLLTPTNLEKISKLYNEFGKWTKCDVFYLNVDSENLPEQITEICNFLTKEN